MLWVGFLGKGSKICDRVARPPKAILTTAHVPRKDRMGVVCSQVMHSPSHGQDTFFSPVSMCLCILMLSWAHKVISGCLENCPFLSKPMSSPGNQHYKKYKTQSNTSFCS